jgi:hypothetical protein
MLFDVRVTAFDPQAAVDPVEALMRLFKIDRTFAREVVHRLPRVIKRGVPLETARRLSQVLERIGARVEILVSERTEDQPAPAPAAAPAPQESLDGARTIARDPIPRTGRGDMSGSPHGAGQQGGTPHPSLARGAGRGLPPPSAAAVAQAPSMPSQAVAQQAGPAALAALVRRSLPQTQGRAEAASLPNMVSLPNPAVQEESPNGQPVSGVLEARAARALREQAAARASMPDSSVRDGRRQPQPEARKVDPRLVETRSESRPDGARAVQQSFDSEMSSASVRSVLQRAAADDGGLGGRVSLPMGSWSEPDNEESRVSAALGRASLPGGSMPDNAQLSQRPSQVALPAAKPSVKEILSRRTLSPPERISRVPGDTIPSGAPGAPLRQQLALPTFNARGSSLGDDIEDLPDVAEQRQKLALFSWLLLLLASVASAGLFFALLALKVWAKKRRRTLELREQQASALLVGPAQLPDLYNCVKQLAIRLEISPSPRLYIAERTPRKVQSFVQNNSLVIVMDAALLSSVARHDAGYIVQFALAHEMAGFALGQHGTVRETLAELWAKIRRGDLLSADALAAKAMADKNEPVRALASLLCGPELAHLVDLAELERQTTSQEQEGLAHRDATEDATFLLPRILHLRRLAAEARPNGNAREQNPGKSSS